MRFMVIVKANPDSEAGILPSEAELTAMGNYNQELVDAGVMVAGEGLHPTSTGFRIRYDGADRTITDGPFTETKELIAGFWILQVDSRDELVHWLRKAPFDGGTELEVRPVFEMDDFGDALTPELRAQEDRQRAEMDARHGR